MFLSFILTCLIIESTPGPNMTYLAILSISDGRRAGFAAVAGVALGLFITGLAAAFGVTALISSSALAYQILRWCGVLYLLWLAWDGWNTGRETSPGKADSKKGDARFFRRGLITNMLNPKAAVFYIAILPGFVDSFRPIMPQTLMLNFIYVLVATVIHSFIVILAGAARQFLDNPRLCLVLRRALSLLLAGVSLWFAIETGKGIQP